MMTRKKLSRFLAIGLCGAVLAGCSTIGDNSADTSTTESEETQSVNTTSSEISSATSQASSSLNSEATDGSKEATTSSTDQEKQKSVDVSSELKMNIENVLLPTNFPSEDPSSVTADITTNEAANYTASYMDNQGELAEVSGTFYENSDEATEKIGVNPDLNQVSEEGIDLGNGIVAYTQGATGTSEFMWQEGNWYLQIDSRGEDHLDQEGVAKKIVEFLEKNELPTPKDQGKIFINYSLGAEDVNVDIHWQDENMIYQLKTTRVPLDALKITVSMK